MKYADFPLAVKGTGTDLKIATSLNHVTHKVGKRIEVFCGFQFSASVHKYFSNIDLSDENVRSYFFGNEYGFFNCGTAIF